MSRRQNVAEISAIHRSTLQSVVLATLYFNYRYNYAKIIHEYIRRNIW